tara:strand:+ start:70 stop:291 length:222 start_codon:yes stop_codon:yes gene_type:complete
LQLILIKKSSVLEGIFAKNIGLKKKKVLKAYKSEMREWPDIRSIEGYEISEKWRRSQIRMHLVEAFKLLRNIE